MTVSRMKRKKRQAAEAQRVADLHRVPLHLHRVQVVQHVVHDHVGAVPGAVGVALPEDRARAGRSSSTPGSCRSCRRASRRGSRSARRGPCPFPLLPLPLATSLSPRDFVRRCVADGLSGWRAGCGVRCGEPGLEPNAVRVAVAVACGCAGRRRRPAGESLPRMMTPVGQRSTQSAQRVQMSSSTMNATWSWGSSPGCSVPMASSIAATETMWMHFHGQMSTQPSQRMHSAWSMWRNCFGLTAWVRKPGRPPAAGSRSRSRAWAGSRRCGPSGAYAFAFSGRPKRERPTARRLRPRVLGLDLLRFCHMTNSAMLTPKKTT